MKGRQLSHCTTSGVQKGRGGLSLATNKTKAIMKLFEACQFGQC